MTMIHATMPATFEDLPQIFDLFEKAIQYQQSNGYIGWNSYDKAFIRKDVEQGLLFKIVCDDHVQCIFSVCYSDELIWREREKGDALYLHRIVLNRDFRGMKVFGVVLEWAIQQVREQNLRFIRMDTWAGNKKLIDYYKSYGFNFIENYTTANTPDLPEQHRNLHVALLEIEPT